MAPEPKKFCLHSHVQSRIDELVPDSLSRCTPDDRKDAEVSGDTPTFETHALVLSREQSGSRDNEKRRIVRRNRSTPMTYGTN